jgi:transcriptional antiterminator Rof (Rho-off)
MKQYHETMGWTGKGTSSRIRKRGVKAIGGEGHTRLLEADKIIRLLNMSGAEVVVVARGQYSPAPAKCERALLYRVEGDRLGLLCDGWLSKSALERISRSVEVGPSRAVGACDALYATSPKYVWASWGDEFWLFRYGRREVRVQGEVLEIARLLQKTEAVPLSLVKGVRCFQTSFWFQRGVSLELEDGRELILAAAKEDSDLHPSYDGCDRICETYWALELGCQLGAFLKKEIALEKDPSR